MIQWSYNLEQEFYRLCGMLSHCAMVGMVLSPQKFQFARKEVEYAELVIGKDNIKPTDSYLENITNFPFPKNISNIRSWYGIVNQVQ